jgi:uncharacterized membrane protein YkvA (DUF1232 family)
MNEKQADFYKSLRKKILKWMDTKQARSHKWSKYIIWAPDLFHLLVKLSLDKQVPMKEKSKLLAAIAYFISPFDILPEMILGPVGYADDIALAAFVLNSIVNSTDPEIIKKHWAGDEDVLDIIKRILSASDEMLGKGLWNKVRKVVK